MRVKYLIIVALMILALIIALYYIRIITREKFVIFCAGSLYTPFRELATEYSSINPSIDIVIEPSGSVRAMKKVTELGKRCDLLALADYKLIVDFMITKYSTFCIVFATNEMVLCYTSKSRYHEVINSDNWYRILLKENVVFGFSNPNDDPAGYRALIVLLLSSLYYREPIFSELVEKQSNIRYRLSNGTFVIEVPPNIRVNLNKIRKGVRV